MKLFESLLFLLNEMSPYILLGFLIAGLMHAFIPQKTFARHLSGKGWKAVIKSTLVGIPLPLCSCGVLPTAIGMRRNGASKAATTSFLIATPQTGVDSIAATWSLLGPAFAVIRPIAALVTAIFGGLAVGKSEASESNTETPSDDCISDTHHHHNHSHTHKRLVKNEENLNVWCKIKNALRYGFIDLVGSIGNWLVAGLIIAAIITVYVPEDFFSILGKTPILSMIAVLVIAIPMYVCATGSIPIAMSLVMKGLSPGTALVLLMAGPAANFASFTLISREMGRKSAAIYLASIILGSVAFGLAIDYLLPASWFAITAMHEGHCHETGGLGILSSICSLILVSLLLFTFIKRFIHPKIKKDNMTTEYKIKGMNCPHCQAAVAKSIARVSGVEEVDVNLSTGIALVNGVHDASLLVAAVRSAGFDVEI